MNYGIYVLSVQEGMPADGILNRVIELLPLTNKISNSFSRIYQLYTKENKSVMIFPSLFFEMVKN